VELMATPGSGVSLAASKDNQKEVLKIFLIDFYKMEGVCTFYDQLYDHFGVFCDH
jgi:hypothetical protein